MNKGGIPFQGRGVGSEDAELGIKQHPKIPRQEGNHPMNKGGIPFQGRGVGSEDAELGIKQHPKIPRQEGNHPMNKGGFPSKGGAWEVRMRNWNKE